ncbi:hypothetical protein PAXRUDRAFT_19314 [Paxillus rubicundulus Ve08.2h10]|uniref:Uncharacterized protein n=1 Tax=Paxillus rubicundulus Ve08.2h10 TaxID=930991 RepID=A0A0D0BUF8_9AGAM|nr:hypothetical protein PAXRUDRAFT_19314 [Paxillus rubicundulus Ve08.2h10]
MSHGLVTSLPTTIDPPLLITQSPFGLSTSAFWCFKAPLILFVLEIHSVFICDAASQSHVFGQAELRWHNFLFPLHHFRCSWPATPRAELSLSFLPPSAPFLSNPRFGRLSHLAFSWVPENPRTQVELRGGLFPPALAVHHKPQDNSEPDSTSHCHPLSRYLPMTPSLC